MRTGIALMVALALAACADPTAPPSTRLPSAPNRVERLGEEAAPISAVITGHYKGFVEVTITWQDNAIGEARTTAGFSDADGHWQFYTQAASADVYELNTGTETGVRSVMFYALKSSKFVSLQPDWAAPSTDFTQWSASIPITK